MARYKLLPEQIAALGMELPEDTGAHEEGGVWLLRFDVPGVGRVRIERGALTEVEEPLPPEPPVGSVVLVGADSASDAIVGVASGFVWRRYYNGWAAPGSEAHDFSPWAAVCRHGPLPVLLTPDPLADAPALPWSGRTESGEELYVNPTTPDTTGVWVVVGMSGHRVGRDVARQMGLALLRAVEEASG